MNTAKTGFELVKSDVAGDATNASRPLTHSLERSKEGLAVDATHTTEEWRPVPGHPDYDVSNLGRVRSWKRCGSRLYGQPRLLNPHHDPAGYVRTAMDGIHRYVHWAVCSAFHGERPDGKEVDHINSVRDDNRAENLRWVTRQENLQDIVWELSPTCQEGHELSGDNLYIRPSNGRRECKRCNRKRGRKIRESTDTPCSVDGCVKFAMCQMRSDSPMCEMHYQRVRKHGDPTVNLLRRKRV